MCICDRAQFFHAFSFEAEIKIRKSRTTLFVIEPSKELEAATHLTQEVD